MVKGVGRVVVRFAPGWFVVNMGGLVRWAGVYNDHDRLKYERNTPKDMTNQQR